MEASVLSQVVSVISGVLIALFSVWLKEKLADRRNFRSSIKALRDEIEDNRERLRTLAEQVDQGLKAIDTEEVFIPPHKTQFNSAWISFRTSGFISRLEREVASKLKEIYDSCATLNNISYRLELVTFTPPVATRKSISIIRKSNLNYMSREIRRLCKNLETMLGSLNRFIDC